MYQTHDVNRELLIYCMYLIHDTCTVDFLLDISNT